MIRGKMASVVEPSADRGAVDLRCVMFALSERSAAHRFFTINGSKAAPPSNSKEWLRRLQIRMSVFMHLPVSFWNQVAT